ncbi:unnamed protein product, partial [Rotaria sp. Silwood2]
MSSSTNIKSTNPRRYACITDKGCIILAASFSLVVLLICIVFIVACRKKRHLNRIHSVQCSSVQQNDYNSHSSDPPPYNWYSESPPPPYNQVK